jgi:HAD superfamily hydrolase (TIGR01549 family)
VVEAVLFDWGDTLMQWTWDPELLAAGNAAGLRALGRPPAPRLTALLEEAYLPRLRREGTLEEIDYPALVREALAESGIEVGDEDLARYLEAEHAAWEPAVQLASTTHALLDTLRERGLRLGLVSNAVDPAWLLHRDLERYGVAERLEFAVFSSEAGWRKPHPAMFEQALAELGVEAGRALFVGDSLVNDVGGAAAVGMRTCQALWFSAEDTANGPEPDFRAFTQMDVLTAVKRLS